MSDTSSYDALVVGCGPVGAIASLHLARAGLRVAVIEEHRNVYPYPRAVMLDAYSCAILAEILGDRYGELTLKTTPGAGYFLDKDELDKPFAWTDLDIGDRRTWFIQPQLEALLRDVIAAHPAIDTYFGWTARRLYADGPVSLTVEDLETATTRELAGTYLLGCDGGGSFVRKQAGGRLITLGDAVLFLVVDARVPIEAHVGRSGMAYQVVDRARPTTYLPFDNDDYCRWEFRINPDDDILALQSPERILELLAPWADPDRIELIRHTVYKFNSLIADRWRFGHVFLCGDAAHQTSPFIGQGLNMGIRNTRNLCHKLDLVAGGHAPDTLLDRYQAECFDDTKATIKEALRMGKLLFNTSAPANALRSGVRWIRRGKPIDITAQIAPATRTLDMARDVPRSLRKVLPHLRVDTADGEATMLTLIEPARPKIVEAGPGADGAWSMLDRLPSVIRPDVYTVVDSVPVGEIPRPLRIGDPKQHRQLFGNARYVALLENSVVLGRYADGDENRLVADVRSAFQLRA